MPEFRVINVNDKTGEYKYLRDSFISAGVDSYNNPPSQNPDLFEALTNVLPVTTGNLQRRWGYTDFATLSFTPRLMFEYQNDSGGSRQLVFSATGGVLSADETGVIGNSAIFTPSGTDVPRMVNSRDYGYFFSGDVADQIKWDGSTSGGTSAIGGAAPTTAISIVSKVAGSVTLTQGRKYYGAFRNSTTGHTTGLSPVSDSSGPVSAKDINLQWTETPADAQFDRKVWLATADAGDETTLYLLSDTTAATTTLADDVPEETLLLRSVWLYTDDFGIEHGIADNDPPPADGKYPVKHKGRLFLASGQFLNCSKSEDEITTSTGTTTARYEECWPPLYQLDISEGAETIRGLLSDGDTLYVATERHIRKITGSGPDDFSLPEIAFNDVGVLNQDVWKIVYHEGAPVGTMWLTPDFRLMISDFNTYRNIGTPVQDLLDSINGTVAETKVKAMFASDGAYDLYMLAIPTGNNTECDTLLVYHVGTKRFFVWQLTNTPTAMLWNIDANGDTQLLFSSTNDHAYKFSTANLTDNGTGFTHTARTSWLNLGEASCRKLLNELEVMGDSSMTVTIEGASTSQDFDSPLTVVSGKSLVLSPFGQYKVYLATATAKYRYYRLTFSSTSTSVGSFLDTINLTCIAENRL